MHRSPFVKPHAQAKKVPPPAIPGDPLVASPTSASSVYQQLPLYRLGGSISAATGKQLVDNGHTMSSLISSPSLEEGGFNLPREPTVALRIKDEISEYSAVMSASSGSAGSAAASGAIAPGVSVTPGKAAQQAAAAANPLLAPHCPLPVFCTTQPLTHKAAVYYHQQLALQEDQGIDLTQSPGRDSPGSSSGSAGSGSRHSTASLDSGRASSYLTGASSIRSSTGCPGGGGALSSPRCSSLSSCSIGSVDRQRNDELIIDWLMEMKYEEYAQLFIAAGYDLPTIARMTPEDLTAIGIKNPHHRERIKQRIDKLQVLDNLPHFVPGSIEEWLQLLRLEEYIQPLLEQNYKTVRDVTQVTWEDLEDIGIVKLGHQKKILLAIKRVKDITSGKWNPGGTNAYQQEYRKAISQLPTYVPTARVSWDDSRIYASAVAATPLVTCMPPPPLPVEPLAAAAATNNNNLPDTTYYCTGSNHECCNGNDMVLIKVRQPRGKSLESLEDIHDNSTRSHLTFSHYTTTDYGHFAHPTQMQQHQQAMQQQLLMQQQQQQQAGNRLLGQPTAMTWRRSYDDGDITPTNDVAATRELMYEEGGGTLPRQQQRGILQRAVLNSMPPLHDHHYMNAAAAAEYVALSGGGASVPGGVVAGVPPNSSSVVLDNSSLTAPYLTGSPMASKKVAPEPPRRHCSIRNSRTMSTDGPVAAGTQQQVLLQHGATPSVYYNAGQGANMHLHGGPAGGGAYAAQQQQPIYANYSTIQQTTAEIHCEKFHDNKSTSSIDSIDTIPFANENTGTIKQRLLNRQECSLQQQQQTATHHQHSSSSSSSSSSSANTIAALTHSFHSLKTSASLHDGSLIRSDSIGSNTSGGSVGPTAGLLHLRSPSLQYPPSACSSSDVTTITTTVEMHTPSSSSAIAADATECPSNVAEVAGGVATTGVVVGPQGSNSKVTANVLNDIGNMLANLTDELDAMLEEEKRVGLNIDSE